MNEPVTYIGFDYGSTNVAAGWLDFMEGYDSAFITFDSKINPYKIHKKIVRWLLEEVVATYDCQVLCPTYVFIESAFKGPNSDTYKKMIRVGHSIEVGIHEFDPVDPQIIPHASIHVQYLDNNTWRKVLFDKGNTKKEIAQEWAYEQWPFLLDLPKSERGHQADALMIAEAGKRMTEN